MLRQLSFFFFFFFLLLLYPRAGGGGGGIGHPATAKGGCYLVVAVGDSRNGGGLHFDGCRRSESV
jgi:hypothetical protein